MSFEKVSEVSWCTRWVRGRWFRGLLFFATREKPTTGEAIEKFVNEDIKGSGSYWLEMQHSFGQWDKMILVFGYVDDRPPCNLIQEVAAEDTPNRQFRCVRAD